MWDVRESVVKYCGDSSGTVWREDFLILMEIGIN
jgi:hypothetical protein